MLITGALEWAASSSTSSCGPAHADRVHVARQHQRGVARRLAARELQLALAQHHRVAAQLPATATSNDTRVRVEGLSNTSATLRPSSACEARRAALASERAPGCAWISSL